jgi:pimeloyl-ACP methyl ester carboxylesterase
MSSPTGPILRSSLLAAGTGNPVLLLHSSASSSTMWLPLIDMLKARFRVLAPDLIGYGRTDPWPDGRDFSPAEELRLIEPLLRNETAGVHVVGHSFGGVVALHLALSRRVAIRSLTLVEPVAFFILRHADEHEALAEIGVVSDAYRAHISAGETDAALRGFIDYWAGAPVWDFMEEASRAPMRRSAGQVLLDFQVTMTDPGMDAIRGLTLPVQVWSGDRSRVPTRRIAAILAELLPNATLEIVKGANHLLPLTHSALFGKRLLEQLDD